MVSHAIKVAFISLCSIILINMIHRALSSLCAHKDFNTEWRTLLLLLVLKLNIQRETENKKYDETLYLSAFVFGFQVRQQQQQKNGQTRRL